mgnify:FL=1
MSKANGKLFLVSTPIGNIKDLSLRAAETLLNAEYIACEDTRRTSLFLQKIKELFSGIVTDINKPTLISYYNENEIQKSGSLLELLKNGHSVVLISDAGTPLLSDPGFIIVREALKNNIIVDSLPGPSAVLTALQLSGLPINTFLFLGFLPDRQNKKEHILKDLAQLLKQFGHSKITVPTVIFYESPHRLVETLTLIANYFKEARLAVCRELTKIHQEVRCQTAEELKTYYEKNPPLGEITLVLNVKP